MRLLSTIKARNRPFVPVRSKAIQQDKMSYDTQDIKNANNTFEVLGSKAFYKTIVSCICVCRGHYEGKTTQNKADDRFEHY